MDSGMSAPPKNGDAAKKKLELPHDMRASLFLASQASGFVMYRQYTKINYDNEILRQEVKSLSEESKNIGSAYERRLAAEKRDMGDIRNIPQPSRLVRPPNWFMAAVVFTAVFAVVVYAQYNTAFRLELIQGWNLYEADVVVLTVLFLAVALWLWFRRNKRPS